MGWMPEGCTRIPGPESPPRFVGHDFLCADGELDAPTPDSGCSIQMRATRQSGSA